MGLITEKVNSKLNDIIGKCFLINRFLDRGMSLLAVEWKLPNCAKVLHPKLAHAYPSDIFADSISEYQTERDMLSVYPETPIGNEKYESVLSFFVRYHRENIELQDMIYDAIDECIEDGDHTTKVFLDSLLKRLSVYTNQSKTLVDAFSKYGDEDFSLQMLDVNIEKYIIV